MGVGGGGRGGWVDQREERVHWVSVSDINGPQAGRPHSRILWIALDTRIHPQRVR